MHLGLPFLSLAITMGAHACDPSSALDEANAKPSQWMGILSQHKCLVDRRLVDITMPGAHDAAAYWLSDRAADCGLPCHFCHVAPLRSAAWGVAQAGSLLHQLRDGVRYLDVRLTIDRDVEGCKDINRVSGECWKAHHCLFGPSIANLTADIKTFLTVDDELESEVVILRLKLEHFESHRWKAEGGHDLTLKRLEALRILLERDLRSFMSEAEDWWLRPVEELQTSKQRLVVLLQTKNTDWLRRLQKEEVKHLHPLRKCSVNSATCDGPLWGEYSNTCCKVSALRSGQRERLSKYSYLFLSNVTSREEMNGAAFHRPLLQLYWTMTWQLTAKLQDDSGKELGSLQEAAQQANQQLAAFYAETQELPWFSNIIMGDWINRSSNFLEVALQSTLRLTFRSTSNVPHQRGNDAKHVDKEPRGVHGAVELLLLIGLILIVGAICFLRDWGCCRRRRVAKASTTGSNVELEDLSPARMDHGAGPAAAGVQRFSPSVVERRTLAYHYQGNASSVTELHQGSRRTWHPKMGA